MKSQTTQSATPILSEFANDPGMQDLVLAFVNDLPGRVIRIRFELDGSDYESVNRLAHQMKGAAGAYGFPTISAAAAVLEKAAETPCSPAAIRAAFEKLADFCHRAMATPPEA